MRITLSVHNADIGWIGGHTNPAARMLEGVSARVRGAVRQWPVIAELVVQVDGWPRQAFIGPTMAPHAALAFTGVVEAVPVGLDTNARCAH